MCADRVHGSQDELASCKVAWEIEAGICFGICVGVRSPPILPISFQAVLTRACCGEPDLKENQRVRERTQSFTSKPPQAPTTIRGRTQPFLNGALSKHKQTHDEVTVRFADPHVLFMIIATSSCEE